MVPRRNPEIVVAVLQEHGDWGSNSARIAAQVVATYVNKKRMQDNNVLDQAGSSKPVEVGAIWSEPSPPQGQAQRNHAAASIALHAGHFNRRIPRQSCQGHGPAGQASTLPAWLGSRSPPPIPFKARASLMRRFLSFRDFDWTLLAMVLLLCAVSVFEIYSATLHTKYAGYHHKQLLWIGGRPRRHVHLRQDRLSPAAGLGALGVWRLPRSFAGGLAVGRKVLGARRWIGSAPCISSPPSGSSWCSFWPWPATLPISVAAASPGKIFSSPFCSWAFPCCWCHPARPGNHAHLHANPGSRPLSGRNQPSPGADSIPAG